MTKYKVVIRANGCDATVYTANIPQAVRYLFDNYQEDVPSMTTLRRRLKVFGHYTKRYSTNSVRFSIISFNS